MEEGDQDEGKRWGGRQGEKRGFVGGRERERGFVGGRTMSIVSQGRTGGLVGFFRRQGEEKGVV